MSEIIDDISTPEHIGPKERHGCVTTWLVLIIVGSIFSSISSFATTGDVERLFPDKPGYLFSLLAFLGLFNAAFAYMLLQYKKVGFYGFIVTSVLATIINILIGVEPLLAVLGLISIGVLYAILQIQNKKGRSAWSELE